jgi:hypothetical protein
MNASKAPRPDGFSMFFYQHYWDMIKTDLLAIFQDFQSSQFNIAKLNCALIYVIPKVQDANTIKKYRPISLLNCSYEIFSKVLTNKLYPILDRLIGSLPLKYLGLHLHWKKPSRHD